MKPTLLILAAGMGSRYGGLKQLDEIGPNGETIIDYSVYDADRAGFGKIVFLIRHDIEDAFKAIFDNRYPSNIQIEYAFQEFELPQGYPQGIERAKPWGTGHAVWSARSIKEPFAAINADDFYGAEAFQQMADFLIKQDVSSTNFSMIGYKVANTLSEHGLVSRGVTKSSGKNLEDVHEHHEVGFVDGKLQGIAEGADSKIDLDENTYVSMNFWGFTPVIFEKLGNDLKHFAEANRENPKAEFLIPEVVDGMIKNGECKTKVIQTSSQWFGVTYKEDKALVNEAMTKLADQGVYPSPLWN